MVGGGGGVRGVYNKWWEGAGECWCGRGRGSAGGGGGGVRGVYTKWWEGEGE